MINNTNISVTDIHMHIIPGVDDGSVSMEMSLEMLRQSYLQGVRKIICTSHDMAYDNDREEVLVRYDQLKKACAEALPGLQFFLGAEILCGYRHMDRVEKQLAEGIIPSMNGTKYILTEFDPFVVTYPEIKDCLGRLLQAGWKPILAHTERYAGSIDDVTQVSELKEMGCLIQINGYSLVEESKKSTRDIANAILEKELADFIGTDAHRTNHRPPKIDTGIECICRKCSREYAERLMFRNAQDLLGV